MCVCVHIFRKIPLNEDRNVQVKRRVTAMISVRKCSSQSPGRTFYHINYVGRTELSLCQSDARAHNDFKEEDQ